MKPLCDPSAWIAARVLSLYQYNVPAVIWLREIQKRTGVELAHPERISRIYAADGILSAWTILPPDAQRACVQAAFDRYGSAAKRDFEVDQKYLEHAEREAEKLVG